MRSRRRMGLLFGEMHLTGGLTFAHSWFWHECFCALHRQLNVSSQVHFVTRVFGPSFKPKPAWCVMLWLKFLHWFKIKCNTRQEFKVFAKRHSTQGWERCGICSGWILVALLVECNSKKYPTCADRLLCLKLIPHCSISKWGALQMEWRRRIMTHC